MNHPYVSLTGLGKSFGTHQVLEHIDASVRPGDVVELEVEGIGVLRNTVGPHAG